MSPEILTRSKQLTEPALKSAVQTLTPNIVLPVNYHFGWADECGVETEGGGKGIRAALAILSAEYVGADAQIAIPGAVAVELVHNFSLIHDDVVDKDPERRHRATVWKAFGLEDAILAGDALLALAFQVLLKEAKNPNASLATAELAQATSLMIAGQQLDMTVDDSPSIKSCQLMESQKTGALLSCSAIIGAILAGGSNSKQSDSKQIEALRVYGMEMGLAFQAVDDLLGIWGDPEITGKPAGNDIQENKRSLPIVIALENSANSELNESLTQALAKENKQQKDIASIINILEELGAKEATLAIANQHLEIALRAIDTKTCTAGRELKELAEFVTTRDF